MEARGERTPSQLANPMRSFTAKASALAFPLGGIGTGNVSLGARGDLRDWEIFNSPGKGVLLPNTFFAIWAQSGNQPPVCKVLEGPIQPPHTLSHGYHPSTTAGLPRLQDTLFRGEYPFAWIEFKDPDLPLQVALEAYTPLVPLQAEDSGLPCAILTYTATNITSDPVKLTLAGSLINPVGGIGLDAYGSLSAGGVGQNINEFREEAALRGIFFRSEKYQPGELFYGDMALVCTRCTQRRLYPTPSPKPVTTHPDVTCKPAWLRGAWFDFLREFWDDFSSDGKFDDLRYNTPSEPGKTDTASLGVLDVLQPGESRQYRFILTWYFPNRPKSWKKCKDSRNESTELASPETSFAPCCELTRNHYAVKFTNSWDVAQYVVENLPRLEEKTRQFHRSLFESTLPAVVLDAISANIVPLRSTTCFWHADGRFYGYEGCFDTHGCCDGTCTHVWSYAQTLAYLFPDLERNMRLTEFVVETEADGYMFFRTYQTFGERYTWPWGDQKPEAAVDGQMGSILRVLREWKLSGDQDWLRQVWPGVKRAIEYAGSHWDTDDDGVLDGRQHNTYDIEFYGPNPLCSVYYLAALRAVEELAQVIGEPELAKKYRARFHLSSQKMDSLLWNGEYYIQKIENLDEHRSNILAVPSARCIQRIRYQHGQGCLSDQLLGQFHARILGLGDLLPSEHIRRAISSIYRYNFKQDLRNHVNCQRTYALNDEAGLILCTWPFGGMPLFPFVYSDEVWTGIEYQVAAHLVYEGFVEEGLAIVQAVRDRHDGIRRNPWNEVECGHHYARSMSSWALLLALSGFQYSAPDQSLAFSPANVPRCTQRLRPIHDENFRAFFSTGSGWGSFWQGVEHLSSEPIVYQFGLRLDAGLLPLKRLTLTLMDPTVFCRWDDPSRLTPAFTGFAPNSVEIHAEIVQPERTPLNPTPSPEYSLSPVPLTFNLSEKKLVVEFSQGIILGEGQTLCIQASTKLVPPETSSAELNPLPVQ